MLLNYQWQDWLKSFILLAMAVYLSFLILTGKLANYINLRFAWLSYVAVLILLLLGIWTVQRLLKKNSLPLHSTTHQPLSWGALILLSLPLLIAILLPSQALTVDAISSISFQAIGGVSAEVSFNVPPEERNVLDWLREFQRVENPAALNGLPVNVTAFVYREPDMADDEFMAARFTISCCVADAMAIALPVKSADASQFQDGQWIQLEGVLEAGLFRGELMPITQAIRIEIIAAPNNPYLYP